MTNSGGNNHDQQRGRKQDSCNQPTSPVPQLALFIKTWQIKRNGQAGSQKAGQHIDLLENTVGSLECRIKTNPVARRQQIVLDQSK